MQKIINLCITIALVLMGSVVAGTVTGISMADSLLNVQATPMVAGAKSSCATIQDGTIIDSNGNTIATGYDEFGYNYQGHLFNGTYDSSDRSIDGTYWGQMGDYVDDKLMMKWSDPWLANRDCNGDGKLDRGLEGGVVGGTSKGWLTNEVNGDYDSNGDTTQDAHYTYFSKIGWVGPGGPLWGEYQVIQEVNNDPTGGYHGLQFKAAAPGFGQNDHWTTN